MDIFSIRCFIMLAEQLNFTKAAYIMNVSQPSLSRIISNLESDMDVVLFDRTNKGVNLTEAGKIFLNKANDFVTMFDDAVQTAKTVADKNTHTIRIAFLPNMCRDFLPDIYKNIQNSLGNIVKLEFIPLSQNECIKALNMGFVDIALMLNVKTEYNNSFEKEVFFRDTYKLALHKNHHLARKKSVSIAEIQNETCLFYKRVDYFKNDNNLEYVYLALQKAIESSMPNKKMITDFLGLCGLLDCNQGISVLPTHVQSFCSDNVKFLEIYPSIDSFVFEGIMCWNKNVQDKRIRKIREIIRDTCKDLYLGMEK